MPRGVASLPPASPTVPALVQPIASDQPLSLRALAQYAHLSVRTLRKALKDPVHPLPYYRVGRKYLVRRSAFDTWLEYYRRSAETDVNHLVREVLQDLR
jgi:excisionase family DNA binding protein